jgi:hypothetical protein
MRQVNTSGRWIWGLSGIVTVSLLVVPGVRLLSGDKPFRTMSPQPQAQVTRTETVLGGITSLNVQSYGAPVRITAGPAGRVQVIETIQYVKQDGGPPAVSQSLSGGRLSLSDPACGQSDCNVTFDVTAPPDVTAAVATGGGSADVSGIAGANLDTDGGSARATGIGGALTVNTGGGSLAVSGLTGSLTADSGGGDVSVVGLAATSATVDSGGGAAQVSFTVSPTTVTLSSDGGPATLAVPGGPYALTAESDGGPQEVDIATNPSAGRFITISSGGGPLLVQPASASASPSGPASGSASAPVGPPIPPALSSAP